jgi:hypothetical protein
MVSLATGIVAEFPTEWVDFCLRWAEEKNTRAGYGCVGLMPLLSLINNQERRDDFVRKWLREANNE